MSFVSSTCEFSYPGWQVASEVAVGHEEGFQLHQCGQTGRQRHGSEVVASSVFSQAKQLKIHEVAEAAGNLTGDIIAEQLQLLLHSLHHISNQQ